MPELRQLLDEILPLQKWKEIESRFVAFRKRTKFVPKKNVMYHLYKAQEVRVLYSVPLTELCCSRFFFY